MYYLFSLGGTHVGSSVLPKAVCHLVIGQCSMSCKWRYHICLVLLVNELTALVIIYAIECCTRTGDLNPATVGTDRRVRIRAYPPFDAVLVQYVHMHIELSPSMSRGYTNDKCTIARCAGGSKLGQRDDSSDPRLLHRSLSADKLCCRPAPPRYLAQFEAVIPDYLHVPMLANR